MEFIRTIKEKHATRRQLAIKEQAEEVITLQDFDDNLYIAYNGTPLSPIDPTWTTKEIVQQLSVFRTNYINSKMKYFGVERKAAVL